ncbi:hypothetical protein ABTZ03_42760 [Kitasatospora sp. NPDC096077]
MSAAARVPFLEGGSGCGERPGEQEQEQENPAHQQEQAAGP